MPCDGHHGPDVVTLDRRRKAWTDYLIRKGCHPVTAERKLYKRPWQYRDPPQ